MSANLPALLDSMPPALARDGASLVYRPDLFRPEARRQGLTSGLSLLAAVRAAFRENGLRLPTLKRMRLYAAPDARSPLELVPRASWATRLVRPGEFIQVVAPVRGGGGGKSPLATILTIAVVVAATVAGGYVAGPLLGKAIVGAGTFVSTAFSSVAGALVSGLIMVGGMMLVTAIAPPSSAKLGGGGTNADEVWAISGMQNQVAQYKLIPIILGKVRYAPVYAANPYTLMRGQKRYGRYLFMVAGRNRVSNLRIGDTPLANFSGVNYRVHENWQGGAFSFFPSAVFEESLSIALTNAGGWAYRTSTQSATELQFEVYFPTGLGGIYDGDWYQRTVTLEAQYRPTGSGPWSTFLSSSPFSGGSIAAPIPTRANNPPATSGSFNIYAKTGGGFSLEPVLMTDASGWSGYALVATGHYTASYTYHPGNFDTKDRAYWALNHATVTATLAPGAQASITTAGRVVTIGSGTFGRGAIVLSGYSPTPFWRGYAIQVPEGQYEFRIRRVTEDNDHQSIFDKCNWYTFRSVQAGQVLPYYGAPMTLIELEIQASEQLNGHVSELNAIFESYCPTWNGTAWVEAVSSNPAALGMLLATGRHIRQNVDAADPYAGIDLAAWQGFYEWCEQMGWRYNSVRTSEETIRDVLHDILAAARAAIAFNDAKYSVTWDHPGKLTVYPLGPRNSWGFKATKAFLQQEPHALRVRFLNQERDFQEDERLVYNDGYNSATAVNIIEAQFDGVTDPGLVYKLARLRLADTYWRPETYEVNLDYSFLVFRKGDRVEVTHDAPMWGLRQARVLGLDYAVYDYEAMDYTELLSLALANQAAIDKGGRTYADYSAWLSGLDEAALLEALEAANLRDASLASAVYIDDLVSMEEGKSYALKYFASGSQSTAFSLLTEAGTSNRLAFATPVPAASAPLPDGLAHFGEAGRETHDCIVTGIDAQDGLTARVTFQDYSIEQILQALTGVIPPWDSDISIPSRWQRGKPRAPVVMSVVTDERVLLQTQSGLIPRIQVGFSVPEREGVEVQSVRVQVRPKDQGGEWIEAGSALPNAGFVYAEGVEERVEYEIRLYAVSTLGISSDYSPTYSAIVIGRTTPPPAPVAVHIDGNRIWWEMPANYPVDVRGWEVWMSFDADDPFSYALRLTNPYSPVMEFDVSNWQGWARRVWVRTVDDVGLLSDPVSVAVNLGDVLVGNVVGSILENADRGWPGAVQDGFVSPGQVVTPYSTGLLWDRPAFWKVEKFWASDTTLSMRYISTLIIPEPYRQSWLALRPTLPYGNLAAVEYRFGVSGAFWNRADFWSAARFWAWQAASDWLPMPSRLWIDQEDIIEIRVTTTAGSQGLLNELEWLFDVEDEVDHADDLLVPAEGVRVPLSKSFRWIKNIAFGLEYREGDSGMKVVWLDKGVITDGLVTAGPLVQCRDANNQPVPGVVDVTMQGAKGLNHG